MHQKLGDQSENKSTFEISILMCKKPRTCDLMILLSITFLISNKTSSCVLKYEYMF